MVTARQIEAYKLIGIRELSYRLASSAMGISERALHNTLNRLYRKNPELRPEICTPVKIISVAVVKDYNVKRKF